MPVELLKPSNPVTEPQWKAMLDGAQCGIVQEIDGAWYFYNLSAHLELFDFDKADLLRRAEVMVNNPYDRKCPTPECLGCAVGDPWCFCCGMHHNEAHADWSKTCGCGCSCPV